MARRSTEADHLPHRVRELRKARGMTIEQLAEAVGLSQPMIGFIELGKRDLKHCHMISLARALGVRPADLLNEDEHSVVLTQDERALLDDYRALDAGMRLAVRSVAKSLSTNMPHPDLDQS